MPKDNTNVLLSIKDRYVQKILKGEKTAEVRRLFSPRKHVSRVYVYVPSPRMEIVGYFDIQRVHKMPIDDLWDASGKDSALSQEEFFRYFSGKDAGVAIHFDKFSLFEKSKSLKQLRSQFSKFHPPQSFIYVSPEMECSFLE
jgi:predicted transcriptional regulator